MTVRDALKAVGQENAWFVTYRAMVYIPCFRRKVDVWVGYCSYQDGELKSLDGDSYSLDDEIETYKVEEYSLNFWKGKLIIYLKTE